MEKAWFMLQAIGRHTWTSIGNLAIRDVTGNRVELLDSMKSIWLAETATCFYLVFSEWDKVDLDEFVLNTEAHPLRRTGYLWVGAVRKRGYIPVSDGEV